MNDNLQIESPTVRLPKQVSAALKAAQDALKDPTVQDPPTQAAADPAQPPAVPSFIVPPGYVLIEEVLKPATPEKDVSRDYWYARAQAEASYHRQDNDRNQKRITDLVSKVEELTRKNAELVKSHPAAKPVVDITKRFTPQQIEAMGEDNCRAILEAAVAEGEERAKAYVDAAVKPLQQKQQQQREDDAATAWQNFLNALTDGFPNWEAVEKDERWKGKPTSFLAKRDPVTKMFRDEIIQRAKERLDPEPIIALLNEFIESLRPAPVPPVPPETPGAAQGGGETFRGDPNAPNPNKLLTQAEIRAGYTRRGQRDRHGKPKMSDEEFKLFEAQVKATEQARGHL